MAELERENGDLREQLEEIRRASARQAAPHRRREATKKPPEKQKRPGRRGGHAGSYRKPPPRVDETVKVPLEGCPHCEGAVRHRQELVQFIEEIPVLRPRVIKLVTCRGECPCCGSVRSRHRLQTSTAGGAAGTHLGPRAQALAVWLNKALGLTMGTTCRVLGKGMGLRLTRGGLSHLVRRVARKVAPDYDALLERLRGRPAVFRAVTALWNTRDTLPEADYQALRAHLKARCDELLAQPCTQPGDEAIRNRLSKQRPHLLGCLWEPAAEPTNNRAERALRPAVIARKLSCGNKTDAGRDAWQTLASLAATCAQRGHDFVPYLAHRLTLASQPR